MSDAALIIPMLLWCPECSERHIDEGEFEHKPHHTHACQHCGHVWRPAIIATKGVRFLPGFKNDPPAATQPTIPTIAKFACSKCGVHHALGEYKPGALVRVKASRVAQSGVGRRLIEANTTCVVREWSQYNAPLWYRVHVEGDEQTRANYDPCELEALP